MSLEVPVIILILSVPIYFFSRWLIKMLKLRNESNRKGLAILLTLFLSPLIYLMIVLTWLFTMSYYPSNDFNREKWILQSETRYTMSEDIIESEMLIGMTMTEVIGLLGQDYSQINENVINYELGHVPRLFNIDPDFLHIHFKNEIVDSVNQDNN